MPRPISSPESDAVLGNVATSPLVPLLLFGFVFWLAALHFPGPVAPPALDPSWEQALGHALTHDWQAGVDYVFTYGPLGYFAVGVYNGELYGWLMGWELVVKLGVACFVYRTLSRVQPAWVKWLFLVLFVFLPADHGDVIYPLAIVLIYLEATHGAHASAWSAAWAASALAVFSLMKLTFCMLAVAAIIGLTLNLLVQHGGRGRLRALVPITAFAVVYVGLWLALDQSIGNLPSYFLGSIQIVAGYGGAMGIGDNVAERTLAGAILLAFAGLAVTSWTRKTASFRQLGTAGLLAICLFFQFKHGFVRQDWQHSVNFFAFALCLAFCVPAAFAPFQWRVWPTGFLLAFVVLLSAIGAAQAQIEASAGDWEDFVARPWRHAVLNVAVASAPIQYQTRLEDLLEERRQEYALPRISALVGDAPVDFLSSEPGILLLNRMNWRPRPAFQSYTAYTRALLELNADWYRGMDAPTYLLFDMRPIDQRFPCHEDGPALLEILGRFEPVLTEKHYLLLKRRSGGPLDWQSARTERVAFGAEVVLQCPPGALQAVTIDVGPSLAGKLRDAAYKPPLVWLRLRLVTGEMRSYRLIPAMSSSRFLLNPLVQDNLGLLQLFAGDTAKQVAALAVVTDDEACFSAPITVTIEECAQLPLAQLLPAQIQEFGTRLQK